MLHLLFKYILLNLNVLTRHSAKVGFFSKRQSAVRFKAGRGGACVEPQRRAILPGGVRVGGLGSPYLLSARVCYHDRRKEGDIHGLQRQLYRAQNIIGYSGDINRFPTVYFQSPWEFGHITQAHGTSQNVGRQEVLSAVGYSIGNEDVGGEIRLVEKTNGAAFHTSRSTFTAVTNGTRGTLAQAITKYSGAKYISDYNDEVFDSIDAAAKAKSDVLHELLMVRHRVE